jgi:hypothetical protein
MPLLGRGALTFWHDVDAEAEADFVEWHVREHIPERLGMPGFLRGRRYVALEGAPRFFNFYEAESVGAFTDPTYLARLDDPSPWTRRVVAHFRRTSRTICSVVASLGLGEGGFVETIRLGPAGAPERFGTALAGLGATILARPGIVAVHVLQGAPAGAGPASAEKALRGEPDTAEDWVLLIEAVDPAALSAAASETSSAARLLDAGARPNPVRGVYRLQFGLGRAEKDAG